MSRYGQRSAQDTIRQVNRDLIAQMRQMSGADSDGIIAAASALRKEIRKTLSTPGLHRRQSLAKGRVRGDPSAPGQPPAMQSGKLARSVKHAVVDGVRRVGFSNYRARILEFGATVTPEVAAASRRSKRGKAVKGKRSIVIPPRPFMARSLAAAEPKMTEAIVGPLAKAGAA